MKDKLNPDGSLNKRKVRVVAGGHPICPAKVFEIMSCGGVMLIDELPGMKYIFPAGSYILFKAYTDDVIEKAHWILRNPVIIQSMGDKASEGVLKAHTHKIRSDQLITLIENRIWEKPLDWDMIVKDYSV